MSDFYQHMIKKLPHGEWEFGPTTQNIWIGYGVFKLMFTVMGFGHELPLDFVTDFAALMATLVTQVAIVTFQVLAVTATVVVRVTMSLVEGAERQIVGGGAVGLGG